jgi:hypothetical protein
MLIGVVGCGHASDTGWISYSIRPMRPDRKMAEMIGRQALRDYGYDELIRRAVKAKILRHPDVPTQSRELNLVGQTFTEAARQAWPVFTGYAAVAGITALVDSPAPGPADFVALGELAVGLFHAGAIGIMVLTMSSDSPTDAEKERCKKVEEACFRECGHLLTKGGRPNQGTPFRNCWVRCLKRHDCYRGNSPVE